VSRNHRTPGIIWVICTDSYHHDSPGFAERGFCNTPFDLVNTRWVGNRRKCISCESSRRRPGRTSTRAAHTELGEAWDALLNFGRAA